MAERDKASEASTKVQEVAANIQQAAARETDPGSKAEAVARRYFEAIDRARPRRGRGAVGAGRPRPRPRPRRRDRTGGRAGASSAS